MTLDTTIGHDDGLQEAPDTELIPSMADTTIHAASKEDMRLNDKLVAAIEKQAELEDHLASAKEELDAARARIRALQADQEKHNEMVTSGLLIQKSEVDIGTENLTKELIVERGHRISAEGSRKEIEKELEDLTSSLFEEANKMVAVERKENASLKERNDHLSTQLKDAEVLLASHQAQLEELKSVMQRMSDRDELHESRPSSPNPNRHMPRYSRDSMKGLRTPLTGTFPSPVLSQQEEHTVIDRMPAQTAEESFDAAPDVVVIPLAEDPEHSAGLLMPRYRTDTIAYTEFLALLEQPKLTRPAASRGTSSSSIITVPESNPAFSPRDLSIRRPGGNISRAGSPALDRSLSTAATLWTKYAEPVDLKTPKELHLRDTKFLKRALIEDIEPTLRLDQGPELGYLSRRAILNAVVEGNLIVEPMPAHLARYRPDRAPCALCGDARYNDEYKRNFRLKTSEKSDSQPYPLCNWCTDRVRSVCTYVAFLKQVKDGLWKTNSESEELRVWEESVKLRESMFWSRVGHIVDM